jgi:hypothetical protein
MRTPPVNSVSALPAEPGSISGTRKQPIQAKTESGNAADTNPSPTPKRAVSNAKVPALQQILLNIQFSFFEGKKYLFVAGQVKTKGSFKYTRLAALVTNAPKDRLTLHYLQRFQVPVEKI